MDEVVDEADQHHKGRKGRTARKERRGAEMAVVLAVGHIDGGLVGRRGNRLAKRMA